MRFHDEKKLPPLTAPHACSGATGYSGISTERIMRAVEQQKRITNQLDHLQARQQARMAPVRKAGPKIFLLLCLFSGLVTLGLLALFLFLPDMFVTLLASLSGIIDVIVLLAQYISAGLIFITRQSWLLSGSGLVIVVMMGLWLRLMRAPQEA